MASAVDGLVSGLDTTSVINQLMSLEQRPQTLLKSKLSSSKTDAAAYRAVNTRFDSLRQAAEALTKPDSFVATKASSSATSVAASATPGAAPGTRTFAVTALTATHAVIGSASYLTATDVYGNGDPLELKIGAGAPIAITLAASDTLTDVATKINAGGHGVSAMVVKTAAGFQLEVTSKTSGTAGAFTLTKNATAIGPVVTQGTDAKIKIGTGPGAYEMTSTSNTFADVLPGLSVTVSSVDPAAQITVSVADDPAAVAAKVKTLVDAANEALKTITSYTDIKSTTALLKGDATLRGLTTAVLDAVSSAIGANGSAGAVGVQLTRTGSLTFDAGKFTAALTADPALARKITVGETGVDGIATKLGAVAKAASDSTTGSLTNIAKAKDDSAVELQTRIDAWDIRLEARRASLNKTYASLETALGRLQSQSNWLSGQLANLPSWSSK
jgi:flagellar hook-associated protein 2